MLSLEETYSGRFFRVRHRFAWRAPHICKAVLDSIVPKPESVIDVGCAIGDIVKGFLDLGIRSYGIEGSKECRTYMQIPEDSYGIYDLRKKINHPVTYDLVTCFEVAEHIEEEFSDIFVDNLCGLSDRILMSYADKGQKGHSHVNCQPFIYWYRKFVEEKRYGLYLNVPFNIRKSLLPFSKKDGVKALFNHNLVYWRRQNDRYNNDSNEKA